MANETPSSDWATFDITDDWSGERLDLVLHKVFDFFPSRSFAARWIEEGGVLLSRGQPKPGFKLRTGDTLEVRLWASDAGLAEPLAEPMELEILFEDSDLIVLNKPAGLVVHPGAGVPSGTLVNALFAHCGATLPSLGERARAGIVHRLDRDTSGVMVVAKSQIALTRLSEQFASHTQLRRYEAICYGSLEGLDCALETGYGRDPRSRTRFKVLPLGEGKRAATSFHVLGSFAGGLASHIECSLETGRTHQIRVHLTHLGCPLVGDPVYGAQPPSFVRRFPQLAAAFRKRLGGQLLHAKLLGFEHPRTGESLEFSTPLRKEMLDALALLKELVQS